MKITTFKPAPGTEPVNLETSRISMLQSPSGFLIELIRHIKD